MKDSHRKLEQYIQLLHYDVVLPAALVGDLVKTSERTLSQPQGVRWGSWETWSACSQRCSRGFRTRKRGCLGAEGRTNPNSCVGSPVEYQDCNVEPCPGMRY